MSTVLRFSLCTHFGDLTEAGQVKEGTGTGTRNKRKRKDKEKGHTDESHRLPTDRGCDEEDGYDKIHMDMDTGIHSLTTFHSEYYVTQLI